MAVAALGCCLRAAAVAFYFFKIFCFLGRKIKFLNCQ